ncbi:TM2 domain-containing protein [Streptomyces reniochalinae]|nr:TM2 domain-containing protein [Streptomyces reniochalinae]
MSNPQQPGYGYPQQPGQNPYNQPPGQPGAPGYGYPQQQPMAPMPGQYSGDPNAPYGYDPYGRPLSHKSKIVAGVLGILLGSFGVGRFYTGHIGMGIGQLAVSICTLGLGGLWGFIDGIIFLTSTDRTDSDGRILRG